MNLPKSLATLTALLLGTSLLPAQIRPGKGMQLHRDVIPQNTAGMIAPEPPPQTSRATTYITLTPDRTWKNLEGKTLQGKLIAFEDMVMEVAAGQIPEPPKPTAHPTVVKEGKVRLLIHKKPFVIDIHTLSAADQEEIRSIEAAHARKSSPTP